MGDFDFLDQIPTQQEVKEETRERARRYVQMRVDEAEAQAELLEMLGLGVEQ